MFNIFILESVIITVLILFPILFNTFLTTYKKITKKEINDIYLNVTLLISFYLSLYYIDSLGNPLFLIFSSELIFLSLIYNKKFISFIIIIIFFEYLLKFNIHYYFYFLLIVFYFLIYRYYKISEMSKKCYITLFNMFTLIFFIIEFYNLIVLNDTFIFINFSFFSYITSYFIDKSTDLFNIFKSLKDIEKEEFIKLSLFKITHEIKNPLAVIKGYLDMFNVNNLEKSTKYINIIKNEIKRTLNLLNDLNDFNKITVNKIEVNFSNFMSELKEICIPYLTENKIKYSFKVENNIKINIDPERIKQVIINLIKNSIEASNEYDKLTFIAYISNNKLYILVEDSGCGMSKEQLNNLFIPFNTTKDYGTGLGICLSKEIIEAHKGTLNYTSIINKGTTAKIVLPL